MKIEWELESKDGYYGEANKDEIIIYLKTHLKYAINLYHLYNELNETFIHELLHALNFSDDNDVVRRTTMTMLDSESNLSVANKVFLE